MAAMVLPFVDEVPSFNATNAETDRAPVMPHRLP
jgi:hypothetical protein